MTYYLSYFIQILLVIHVLKTGRDRYWIWLLLFLPIVGGIAYLVVEILPDFRTSITGQRALNGVKKAVNPGADLRVHEAAWEQSPNADNARRLVSTLLDLGQPSQAARVLDQAMTGLFKTEPSLMLLKARAEFDLGRADQAVSTLKALQDANPEFKSPEGHLLLARALEQSGAIDECLEEYASVITYFPGAEARFRYVEAMGKAGQIKQAISEAEQILRDAALAPRHFQKSQKPWLKQVENQLKDLQKQQAP